MNDNAMKEISNQEIPFYTVLKNLINKTDYINIGCISKIHSENYVDVTLYYKDTCGKKVVLYGVRLLHIGTTKCKINIIPAVGDNVLLLCPRDYIDKLVNHVEPKVKTFSSSPYGDVNMCGILIKDEADDNVKTTISINENGDVTVNTDGKVGVDAKEDVTVSTKKNVNINSDSKINLNGNANSFVTFTEFNTKMQEIMNLYNTHVHVCADPGKPCAVTTMLIANTDLSTMQSKTVLLGDTATSV